MKPKKVKHKYNKYVYSCYQTILSLTPKPMSTAKTIAFIHMREDGFLSPDKPQKPVESALPWWCAVSPVRPDDDRVKRCRGVVSVDDGKVPVRRSRNSA